MSKPDLKGRIKTSRVRCSKCAKFEMIEITATLLETCQGGIGRAAIVHKCLDDEQKLLIIYFDEHCAVRNTILMPIIKKEEDLDREKIFYVGVLTPDEALELEKDAFILDKTILRVVCEQGPVSLGDIRRLTISLESALGIRIDLPLIDNTLKKLIKKGLVTEIFTK
ncbi:MAG: hypothetical protein ACFFC7_08310 [Candidatus Hermodarchaeota archaeon]